jgi:AcrR family transcriptional regulator
MAKKGIVTRELIVEKAAALFNTRGYYRASLSDLMAATGLEKGGIYNHFENKDALAVASFEYAVRVYGLALRQSIEKANGPFEKVTMLIEGFRDNVASPPLPGGCPLLNCAVENDEGNPLLKSSVIAAFDKLLSMVQSLVQSAQIEGELDAEVDSRKIATFIISSLEGGIMLSRLFGDKSRMDSVVDNLKIYLQDMRPKTSLSSG